MAIDSEQDSRTVYAKYTLVYDLNHYNHPPPNPFVLKMRPNSGFKDTKECMSDITMKKIQQTLQVLE